jgi:UrcA family protein
MTTITGVSRPRTAIVTMLFVVVAAGIAISPAVADSLNGPKVIVKFRDLNVSTPQGAATLYARIRAAAYDVCLEFDSRDNISALPQRENCVEDVIINAVIKLNNPALSAVYGAETGKEVPQRCTTADTSTRRGSREGSRHDGRSA